jgi:hypothetical protein
MSRELTLRLTPVEVDHLLTVIQDSFDRGDYYGARQQYWDRHERILNKLEAALIEVTKE